MPASPAPGAYPDQAAYGPQYAGPEQAGPQHTGPQYTGPPGYAEYAQVIREDAAAHGPAPREGAGGRPEDQRSRGYGQLAETRAITIGAPAEDQTPVSEVSPAVVIGDGSPGGGPGHDTSDVPGYDGPAYGPPGPDWYRQDSRETGEPSTRAAREAAVGGAIRSPFEPLKRSGHEPGSPGQNTGDSPGSRAEQPQAEDYGPASYESPDDFELDLSGLEGDAVGQLHGLYAVAGAMPGGGSDAQFHQLLERQRKLISEYFKESGGHGPTAPPAPGPTASPARTPAHGAEAGEVLAGMRGKRLSGR